MVRTTLCICTNLTNAGSSVFQADAGHITASFCQLHLITGRKTKCERRVLLHVTWFWRWSELTDGFLATSGRGLLKQSPNWSSCFYWWWRCPFILVWTQPPEGPLRSVDQITSLLHLQKHPLPCSFSPHLPEEKLMSFQCLKALHDLASGPPTSSSHTGLIAAPGKHQDWMECLSLG